MPAGRDIIVGWTCSRPLKPPPSPELRNRADIDDRYKWNLDDIFSGWDEWQRAYDELERQDRRLRGAAGHARAGRRSPARGDAAVRRHRPADVQGLVLRRRSIRRGSARQPDQRAPAAGADPVREGQPGQRLVQSGTARDPAADGAAVDGRRAGAGACTASRIEDLYRQQEHVLDEKGEHLLSLASRFSSAPNDAYAALSTADIKHPTIKLSTGAEIDPDLRSVPRHPRDQSQPERPRGVVRRLPQAVRRQREHLRLALQRRPAARLVPRAVARLQDDARLGAARQQHPAGGGREPDRDHRRPAPSRCGATIGCASASSASTRTTTTTPRSRSSISIASIRTRTCWSGCRHRSRRSGPSIRGTCARPCAAAGSTSTRTRASAAAPTRRRCTACTRTCC